MKLSTRTILKGVVSNVAEGAVNGLVTIDLGDQQITADITMEAIEDLELVEGKEAYALVKATNVLFASGSQPVPGVSARNQMVGVITSIFKGATKASVVMQLPDGNNISGSISNAAVDDLGLRVGEPAVAIVKASNVMVGVDD